MGKRIKITERQVKLLSSLLIKEEKDKIELKHFNFDWDDNILHMPTTIKMVKDGEPVELSTEEFAEKRMDPAYTPPEGNYDLAFVDFRDDVDKINFLQDSIKALDSGDLGPSWGQFKNALIKGNLVNVITARGQSEEAIRKAVDHIVYDMFTQDERDEMFENIKGWGKKFGHDFDPSDQERAIKGYLDNNRYIGVMSPGFLKTLPQGSAGAESPEVGKQIATTGTMDRLKKSANKLKDIHGDNVDISTSLGFSDDDKGNVDAIVNHFEELSSKYPNLKLRVYDTSNPKIKGGKKIKIKK